VVAFDHSALFVLGNSCPWRYRENSLDRLPEVKSGEIKATLQQIRNVIGEIPILASEQKLLDEANNGVEVAEEKEKPKEGQMAKSSG